MEIFLKPETWVGMVTLVFLEIVLGIDNIIFISFITNKLSVHQRQKARAIGLGLALVVRCFLLCSISWLVRFSTPFFTVLDHSFSARDLILGLGGLFLIAKSTTEMIGEMEDESHLIAGNKALSLKTAVIQIILIDIVFSFDSILTAVGLTDMMLVMIAAVIVAMVIMLIFSGAIGDFIKRHPSMEILALGFLNLIGFMLTLEAFHYRIPKGYIYFAIAFSFLIEMINIRTRKEKQLVRVKSDHAVKQAA